MSNINFDEFQREIDEAEKYLQKGKTGGAIATRTTSQENENRTFTSLKDFAVDEEGDLSVNSGKYSSPADREKLINRLLEERNRKTRATEAEIASSSSSLNRETIMGEVSLTPLKSVSDDEDYPLGYEQRDMLHFSGSAVSYSTSLPDSLSGDFYSGIYAFI